MNTRDIIIIILTLVLSPIAGCLLAGIDRKLTARMQHRQGPPILQPLYDFLKLMNKENVVVNRYQNIYPLFYLGFVIASLLMLVFQMDLLMIIFTFTIAGVALIVGAMSTGSPYSRVGAQREIMAILAYEPILIFYIVAMYMVTGSFKISFLNNMTVMHGHDLFAFTPLIFIAMIFVMAIKFRKSPFDFSTSHHGHQELVKGILTEYSGPGLALIELTHWYETIFLLGLAFLFFKTNFVIGIIEAILTFILLIIIDNISARATWQWMVKLSWTVFMGLCILNIIALYFWPKNVFPFN